MTKEEKEPHVEQATGELHASHWKRDGFKKLDTIMVESKHGQQRVDIRFNSSTGYFGAALADMTFKSRDYHALVKKMRTHLASVESLEYTRYLKVDYDERLESDRGRHGSKAWSGRHEGRPVSGIYLEFDVYDVSNEFDTAVYGLGPRGTTKARVWRRMKLEDGEWVPASDDETRHEGVYGDHLNEMIPFTEERYQTLVGIKESFQRVATILDGMFGEKAIEAGKHVAMLDAMSGQKLLPAPPEPEAPKKTKGRKR